MTDPVCFTNRRLGYTIGAASCLIQKEIQKTRPFPLVNLKHVLGFAGGGFVALAGTGRAAAGCAPEIAHPAEQHTFSEAPHIPA